MRAPHPGFELIIKIFEQLNHLTHTSLVGLTSIWLEKKNKNTYRCKKHVRTGGGGGSQDGDQLKSKAKTTHTVIFYLEKTAWPQNELVQPLDLWSNFLWWRNTYPAGCCRNTPTQVKRLELMGTSYTILKFTSLNKSLRGIHTNTAHFIC